jgi:hypothetical protein
MKTKMIMGIASLAIAIILGQQSIALSYPSGIEDYAKNSIVNDPEITSRLDFWQANYLLTDVLEIICTIKQPYSQDDVDVLDYRLSGVAESINSRYEIYGVSVMVSDVVANKPVITQFYKGSSNQ